MRAMRAGRAMRRRWRLGARNERRKMRRRTKRRPRLTPRTGSSSPRRRVVDRRVRTKTRRRRRGWRRRLGRTRKTLQTIANFRHKMVKLSHHCPNIRLRSRRQRRSGRVDGGKAAVVIAVVVKAGVTAVVAAASVTAVAKLAAAGIAAITRGTAGRIWCRAAKLTIEPATTLTTTLTAT